MESKRNFKRKFVPANSLVLLICTVDEERDLGDSNPKPLSPFPQPCKSGEIVCSALGRLTTQHRGSDHGRGSLELGCFDCGLGPKPDGDRERHVMAACGDVVIVDGE